MPELNKLPIGLTTAKQFPNAAGSCRHTPQHQVAAIVLLTGEYVRVELFYYSRYTTGLYATQMQHGDLLICEN